MNKLALTAALALTFSATAHAKAIDLQLAPASASAPSVAARLLNASLSPAPGAALVVPPRGMSELPEPEVFAMMLVGLVLIGYRASRDSSEKFK